PTTPQNRYRALHNDIAALIALSLTNQHNPDDLKEAWQLSEQLRDHFHTHPTPALPGGTPPQPRPPEPTTGSTGHNHTHAGPSHNNADTPRHDAVPDDASVSISASSSDNQPNLRPEHLDSIGKLAPDHLPRIKTLLLINPNGIPADDSHLPSNVLNELFNPSSPPRQSEHDTEADNAETSGRFGVATSLGDAVSPRVYRDPDRSELPEAIAQTREIQRRNRPIREDSVTPSAIKHLGSSSVYEGWSQYLSMRPGDVSPLLAEVSARMPEEWGATDDATKRAIGELSERDRSQRSVTALADLVVNILQGGKPYLMVGGMPADLDEARSWKSQDSYIRRAAPDFTN
ncbi:hypothetical protein ACFWBV_31695, partial [Streptomyces sp. NPDC060030]|uniref:hypothetical protein n=1 Tax=Streptomyces sp. NPDC060030 TaxID=3347042 RepID=UPI0036B2C0D9